jgi:beta-glucosidase/6-phospho-beta-glucosidase/beta-galactosidase
VRFCGHILNAIKDDVTYILTLNEPMVFTALGYFLGEWPPGKKSLVKSLIVADHFVHAHNRVYKLAKSINPLFKISIAHNTNTTEAADNTIRTKLMLSFSKHERDTYFLMRTYRHMDFLGINWYNYDTFSKGKVKNPCVVVSDLG